MRFTPLCGLSIIAILAGTAAAHAADKNTFAIDQVGPKADAQVYQYSLTNSNISLRQYSGDKAGVKATIVQTGYNKGTGNLNNVTAVQEGFNLKADIKQGGSVNTANLLQQGSNSTATIEQYKDGNIANVTQAGNSQEAVAYSDGANNSIGITQFGEENYASARQQGDANKAVAYQDGRQLNTQIKVTGSDNNTHTVLQGVNNRTIVNQGGLSGNPGYGNNLNLQQYGVNNRSDVDQGGNKNNAIVYMDTNGGPLTVEDKNGKITEISNVTVKQFGDKHSTDIKQMGSENYTKTYQDGFENIAAVEQYGNASIAHIFQGDSKEDAKIYQTSDGAVANISQYGGAYKTNTAYAEQQNGSDKLTNLLQQGNGNIAATYQWGTYRDQAYISQNGDDNTATVAQDAKTVGNSSAITQTGYMNGRVNGDKKVTTFVVQQGSNGVANIDQTGERNSAGISQAKDGQANSATVGQVGKDNGHLNTKGEVTTFIAQSGNVNVGQVYQTGDLNSAGVSQQGNNNSGYISQVGSNNVAYGYQFTADGSAPAGDPFTALGAYAPAAGIIPAAIAAR